MTLPRGTLACTLVALLFMPAALFARNPAATGNDTRYHHRDPAPASNRGDVIRTGESSMSMGVTDTVVLGSWKFTEQGVCREQGWYAVDRTEQPDDYFHVDDFSGLGGGSFGGLVALQGNQSLWCGLRPGSTVPECGYALLPGYGNLFDQTFCTNACLSVTGDVSVDYLIAWDSEPQYDYTTIDFDQCDDAWREFGGGKLVYSGKGSGFYSDVIADSMHTGSVRVRLHFISDGGWSDEDGLYNSDGGVIIDSLTVRDGNGMVLHTELFEAEASGAKSTASGNWSVCRVPGYGDFSGVFQATQMVQEDPCKSVTSCVWGFFAGSTYNYACGGFPSQAAVPYVNQQDQYLRNEVWSPVMPWVGAGAVAELSFEVYRDLKLDALIFYVWHIRSIVNGCPGEWKDDGYVYFGAGKDWLDFKRPVGGLIDPNADEVQLALGAWDLCDVWCGVEGTGNCHSHSPMFGSAELVRIDIPGPQFTVKPINLFQDNFAADGTTTGAVRADIAMDLLPPNNLNIQPGDSSSITVSDPVGGLAPDGYTGFGSAVYCYVSVHPQNQAGKGGGALTTDPFRWPVVDSLTHNGEKWYCIRMDTTFVTYNRGSPVANEFCVDLNDDLFTPGDTVNYVFAATGGPPSNTTTYYGYDTKGPVGLATALASPIEFTCLPAGGWLRGGDILYVDGYDGRGAEPFFDTAFDLLGMRGLVDRYDILGPSSSVGNRPGARVVDVYQQILGVYRKIIWSTGSLYDGVIGTGDGMPEKSNDAFLLHAFIDQLGESGGIYFTGDHIAAFMSTKTGTDINALKGYVQHSVVSDSHEFVGLGVAPLMVGESGSAFDHLGVPDTLVAYGGCPTINSFDVIDPVGAAVMEATYRGNGLTGGAIVSQRSMNAAGTNVGVMLSGFSFHEIRDHRPTGLPARAMHLYDVLTWLGSTPSVPVNVPDGGLRYSLGQNYPNPFNPTTTIRFTLARPGPVTLRVYNVAGQLVRTLTAQEFPAGVEHVVTWDGRNRAGLQVASGVYFYRLTANDFVQTRKMVLLK